MHQTQDMLCFLLTSSLAELGAHTDWRHLLHTEQGTVWSSLQKPGHRGRLLREKKQVSISLCLLFPFSSTEDAGTPLFCLLGTSGGHSCSWIFILVTKYLEAEERVFMAFFFSSSHHEQDQTQASPSSTQ